ncbi:MAG: hypothetical protein IJ561_04255 [Ruminococcus sp.]|nr:hypothetical protein [Ruminococcus sp.]
MKKLYAVMAAALMLAGCGNTATADKIIGSQADASSASDANQVAEDYWAQAEKVTTPPPQTLKLEDQVVKNGDIDVDLTSLSQTLGYAQLNTMLQDPASYLGQKVKAKGTFAYTTDPTTGGEYFAVFIQDVSACCNQELEFVLSGDFSYPEDYPEIGAEIVIEGTFNQYEENGWKYCQLKDASMEVV